MAPTDEPLLSKDSGSKILSLGEAEAHWADLSYRDRFRIFFKEKAGANYTLPVFIIVFVTINVTIRRVV